MVGVTTEIGSHRSYVYGVLYEFVDNGHLSVFPILEFNLVVFGVNDGNSCQ